MILVIEDEPGIVDFLERGLRAHGFEVSSALDGTTGTEKALSEDVDLVVLDMMLPGRNGMEVLFGQPIAAARLLAGQFAVRHSGDDRCLPAEGPSFDVSRR